MKKTARHNEMIIQSSGNSKIDAEAVANYGTNTRCEVCGYIYGNAKAASDCAKAQKGRKDIPNYWNT